MNRLFIVTLLLFSSLFSSTAKNYILTSPDGKISVNVIVDKGVRYSVSYLSESLLIDSPISINIRSHNTLPGEKNSVIKVTTQNVDNPGFAVVPTKYRTFRDKYHELRLHFRKGFSIIFRAYDNGVAYRFVTDFSDGQEAIVESEMLELNFSQCCTAFFPDESPANYLSHFEAKFEELPIEKIENERYGYLPIYLRSPKGTVMVFTETDLSDYPNMVLYGTNGNTLTARFPHVVKKVVETSDRNQKVISTEDYIARTSPSRSYPWRLLTIDRDDASLLNNYLTYQLASECKQKDVDWIRPGKVAWDWWNALNIDGVDFVSGINTDTYKYYIDFASKYALEYIILDEGWSASTTDIKSSNPELNLQEIIEYGRKHNVGVILWTLWGPLNKDIDGILDLYEQWGVKGIKVDFMQRIDQDMVNYYEKVAKCAFDRHMLVDFHGAYKPSGLQRRYPNVLSFEGVRGLESNKWSRDITPEHDLILPFTRMVAGPMDFTPGATLNASEKDFVINFNRPMSQGTRAHQAAMYIVYESPLQMLSDTPSNYYRAPEFTSFISRIPTVWDTTVALDAKIGEYLAIARRQSDKWYVGAMAGHNAHDFSFTLDFLEEGVDYQMESLSDGPNVSRCAIDASFHTQTIHKGDMLTIHLADGGGFAAIITKQ